MMKDLMKVATVGELTAGYYYTITDSMYGGYYGELNYIEGKIVNRIGTASAPKKRECKKALEELMMKDKTKGE